MYSVREQQYFLKHYYAYYKGAIDGISGSGTKTGIRLFQENHGLTADGIWGKNTDAKCLKIVKKIQEKLNESLKIEMPITDKVREVLTNSNIENALVEDICAYVAEKLGEKATKLEVDGIMGENNIEAIRNYQWANGLDVDGIIGTNTAIKMFGAELITPLTVKDWSLYPNFERSEFVCKCGGKYCNGDTAEMYTAVLEILQKIRNDYGKAVHITSGVRCPTHNRNVDGVNSSRHKLGKAVDFYIKGVGGDELVRLAYKYGCRYAYNIDGGAIHFDVY